MIPKEWDEKRKKTDGGEKKAIIYYVSVSVIFSNEDIILKKIKSTLRIFDENKEEILAIWKIDPQIEALDGIRPALYGEIRDIIQQKKEEGNMIIDDRPDDENELTVYADAYYGDGGYMGHLMSVAKKPVMIADPKITDDME